MRFVARGMVRNVGSENLGKRELIAFLQKKDA